MSNTYFAWRLSAITRVNVSNRGTYAKIAADGKDVRPGGGVQKIRQFLLQIN